MKITPTIAGIMMLVLLTSGVYRHDTPIEKYLDLASQSEFDCVGNVYKLNEGKWVRGGSCILVDSLHIITAAHVIAGEQKKDTVVDYNGHKVKTYIVTGKFARPATDFWFLVNNEYRKAKAITICPGYLDSKDYNSYDIAIIELNRPIKNAATIQLNEIPDEVSDTVTIVGFGGSGPANATSPVRFYGIKLGGQNIIDSVSGVTVNGMPTILHADLDCPNILIGLNKTGSPIPLELEYGTKGGDSGSPLFRTKNDSLQLIGILSCSNGSLPFGVNGYYGQVDGWVRIAAFHEWIKKQLNLRHK